jgi:general secretion pathway protein G
MHLLLRRRRSRELGFTLIELLIVVSLIVVLATISLATYHNSVQRGREAVLKEDLYRMRDAIDQHFADKGKYPTTLEDLVSAGYLRAVPVDPITQSATTWQTIQAEPDPTNPTTEPGVYNVKSGAEGEALDGSKFSEW